MSLKCQKSGRKSVMLCRNAKNAEGKGTACNFFATHWRFLPPPEDISAISLEEILKTPLSVHIELYCKKNEKSGDNEEQIDGWIFKVLLFLETFFKRKKTVLMIDYYSLVISTQCSVQDQLCM